MRTDTSGGNLVSQEVEELADRLDVALLRLGRVEQANHETVPLAVIHRLSDGAVPTMVWRESRELTREGLATVAGSRGELVAQVMRGSL